MRMVSIPLVVVVFSTLVWCGMVQPSSMLETRQGQEIVITRLKDATKGGHGYRLRYTVPVALHTYWNFKTDFDSDYLLTNRYITHHEFIAREQNRVITQNAYSYRPRVWFRWRTTVHSDALRLDFHLLNPEECGQKFHYGFIQVEGLGDSTRVTQVAYFDFFGASIWSHFPGMGGMHDMLQYMARWEQRITQKLESRYASPRGKTVRP